MSIDWASFSWEAFATLATGLAAVIAAGIIGFRQSQIHDRQVALQEQELKVSLLEERLSVYDSVHDFFGYTLTHGRPADGSYERNYQMAMVKARFLFSDDLNDFLKQVWHKHCDFGLHNTLSKADAAKNENERHENVKLASEDLKWFVEKFGRLHKIFDEIRPVLPRKLT